MSAGTKSDGLRPLAERTERSGFLPRLKSRDGENHDLLIRLSDALAIGIGVPLFILIAPQFHGDTTLFIVLLALTVLAERMPISIYGDSTITISFVVTLTVIGLFGAQGAALAAPFEILAQRVGWKKLDFGLVPRIARAVIYNTAAAGAYTVFAPVNPERIQLSMIPASLAATVVAFALSALVVVWTVARKSHQPLSAVWSDNRWVAAHYMAFGVVGLSFLASYVGLGYWGFIAFLTPVVLLQVSTKLYVDKTAENVEKLKRQNVALESANIEIRRVSDELRVTYNSTLETLVSALEARDQETKGHSLRVARYMLNIAEALGVQPGTQEWLDMQHGALLHDVGKIGVRDSILLKPGALTPEEWDHMRKHPEIGYNILKEVKFLDGAARIVLAHHERWDGNGYPNGLKADDIPLGARIFSVVDTFDCMTSDRVYRKAQDTEESLKEILRCSGSQFDPLVVEAFLDIYDAWVLEHHKLHAPTIIRKAA